MNIVLIHYAASPVVGGVETVMARHARLMAEAGHHVCIVAGRGGQTDERIGFAQVPEVDSRSPQVMELKSDLDVGRVPAAFEPLVQRIESELSKLLVDADRVIAHNVCSLNKNLALTAALYRMSEKMDRARLILWHHDLAWTTPRYEKELHEGYPWDLLKRDWPRAEQVVVSRQRQQELVQLLGVPLERIQVIPNGVDMGEFLKLEDETERLVMRLGLTSATPFLLLPVRLTPRKNVEMALRVLAALRRQYPQAALVITGPLGPHNPTNQQYFERLLRLRDELGLGDSAFFLAELVDHPIPDAVVADLYRLADLLFLPSREEGFGIPVLEAGLAGIPIFCADIPALRELAMDQAHYFAPDEDPERVAEQIGESLRASRAFLLRKRVLQHYTWREIYDNQIAPLLAKG